MESGNLINCGALIFCRNTKRFLFVLRNGAKFSGYWAIPGGKVEKNESIISALIREINEELGVDFSDRKFTPIESYTSDNLKFEYHTFIVEVDSEFLPILNKEHRGWMWCELQDRPQKMHPSLIKMLNTNEIKEKVLFFSLTNNRTKSTVL